jgi:hypothetical protein
MRISPEGLRNGNAKMHDAHTSGQAANTPDLNGFIEK